MIGGTRMSRIEGQIGGPLAWLLAHVRTPLYRDGYAILLATGLTAVLGIVYWAVAARLYPAAIVGLNTALLSAMMLVSALAQLNMNTLLPRYLPVVGRSRRRLIGVTYAGTLLVSLVLAVLAVLVLPRLTSTLGELGDVGAPAALLFVVGALAFTIFTLQDSVLIGLRRAVWVPVENLASSLLKLALLPLLLGPLPRLGIMVSWIAGAVALIPPVTWLVHRRLRTTERTPEPAARLRPIASLLLGNNIGMTLGIVGVFAMPLLVVGQLGSTANAYFYGPWSVFLGLQLVSASFATSLLVEGADPASHRAALMRATVWQSWRLLVPAVALLCLLASPLLSLFGPEYEAEGTTLLRLLALACLPNVLVSTGVAKARLYERPWTVALIHAATALLGLGLSALLLPVMGIDGAGVAWLVAQSLVGAITALDVTARRRDERAKGGETWGTLGRARRTQRHARSGGPRPPLKPRP
jgi:O-antigen/teichoic acid export membrane protein